MIFFQGAHIFRITPLCVYLTNNIWSNSGEKSQVTGCILKIGRSNCAICCLIPFNKTSNGTLLSSNEGGVLSCRDSNKSSCQNQHTYCCYFHRHFRQVTYLCPQNVQLHLLTSFKFEKKNVWIHSKMLF